MTHNEAAAYINSESTSALIRAMGMQAENQHRLSVGESIIYGQDAFEKLLLDFQVGHNAAISTFNQATQE